MYTVVCNGDEKKCKRNAEAFEKARQANLNQTDEEISATAKAFGEPGEENGIKVTFGEVEAGAAANVKADIEWSEDGGFRLVATVTIDPSVDAKFLRINVGHEGQHVLDAQAFAATFTADGDFDVAKNLTVAETETNAYRITQRIAVVENKTVNFRGKRGKVKLGVGVPPAKAERAIKEILGGPLYANKLDSRQIARFAP